MLTPDEAHELMKLASEYHWAGYHEGVSDSVGRNSHMVVKNTANAAQKFQERLNSLTEHERSN